jgi:hypothetical protein
VAAVAAQAPSTAQRSASAGTPLTLAQALAAEKAALKVASSVRVVGRVVTRSGTFGVDLRVGANSIGTLRYAAGTVAIRRIGTALYLNADDAFYTGHGHPELLAEYHNKWMQIPADDPIYATVIPLTRLATWTTLPAAAPAKVLHRGALVAGVPAVTVTGGTGPKASVLYLSAKAPMYPLAAVSADRLDGLAFSGWNRSDPTMSTPTGLVNEPDDTVLDVPTYPEATAQAFSVLWKP